MKTNVCSFVKVLLVTIVLCNLQEIQSQNNDSSDKEIDWVKEIKSSVTPYGTLRLGAGFVDNEIGIVNSAPWVGLKVKHALSKNKEDNFNVIGQIEFGLNLVSRDDTVEFAVDGESAVGRVGDAVYTRIGFAGISYKNFQFTFGKQNSVYYSLGAKPVYKTLAFGGKAIGVWNIADGGISGTGRANQVFQLTYKKNGLRIGLQGQARQVSENSEAIDTYGFGANYIIQGFTFGIGYNKVLDGVENPEPNQAKDGDEAFVVSTSYEKNRFTIAASYANLKQHQKTGSTFYDATGIEIYTRYKFSKNKHWHGALGYNDLTPKDDQNLGDFNTRFGIIELGYNFKKASYLFASSKLDFSKNVSGENRNFDTIGIGIRFGF